MPTDLFEEGSITTPKKVKRGSTTPILDNFSRDLIALAAEGKLDPIIGRENEVKRIAQILSRKKKNNVVIVGESGVGKCICKDSKVTIRNDKTNEVFLISVEEFIKYLNIPML